MSADGQAFLDVLNSVPRHLKHFSDEVADYVEAQVDRAAAKLRETLSHAEWVPESVRPRPPPKPVSLPRSMSLAPATLYTRINSWVLRNKILTGTFVVGIGASIWMVHSNRAHYARKRRARRAGNGGRVEAVVIAGSFNEPIVKSLARDLERRGFIVYVVCESVHDEMLVQNEGSSDIRPLLINVLEVCQLSIRIKC